MLLDEKELNSRLESPFNLLNRLREVTNPHRPTSAIIPSLPPTAEDVVDNFNDKIKDGSIKSKAMGLMNAALDELQHRMPEVQKPEKLASIVTEMSKVISNMEQKNDNNGATAPQIIIYAPQILNEETFNTIELNEA